jgi:hypothetical protein
MSEACLRELKPMGGPGGGAAVAPPRSSEMSEECPHELEPMGGPGGGAAVAPPRS